MSIHASHLRVLPAPDRPYPALREDLVRLGWQWANESQILPIVPGEPEWVEYRHAAGGRLRYVFNPAVGLREIEASGPPEALAGLSKLPQLGVADVAALLEADAVEEILRGLFAARALRLVPLLGRVQALCKHPDDLVRSVAADVARTMPPEAVREAWERFQALRAARPERSALFTTMAVADRRQVLRWMGRDLREANADVLAALRSGLADEDAEVRATAALVAAKLGAAAVRDGVDAVVLPAPFERARAVARAAIAAGARLALPEPTDDETLLLHALLSPVPVVPPPPPRSWPRHLRAKDGVVRLARSGIEVALVPSMPHWIGSSADPARPLRRATGRPFAIGVVPLDGRAADAVGAPVDAGGPLLLTSAEALALAGRLGALEGVTVSLPGDEAWEMAIRGPDGRRFAAGNLAPEAAVSPWGVAVVPGPEWIAGGLVRDAGTLAAPRPAGPDERHPARFALAFPV
jgi:hypothetical protein